MIRPMVFTAAVLAVTLFAMTAFTSSVSAQTPTATATAAAPKATATTAAPAKTGNAGLSSATSTSTVLVLSFVAIAGVATLAARRATRSN